MDRDGRTDQEMGGGESGDDPLQISRMTTREREGRQPECQAVAAARRAGFWIRFGKVHQASPNVSWSRRQLRSWASAKRSVSSQVDGVGEAGDAIVYRQI